jgi:glycosyltransferase involved in cell wall biosynthesis
VGLGKSDLDRLGDIRRPSPPYRVSVICPTLGRRANYHAFIYECFRAQTWPDKELIVFDDGGDPSPVFRGLDDRRVTYVHVRRLADVTLGAKRTAMQRLASGCIIACFDDDNIYAPTYLEAMVPHLVESGCPTVSLNGSFLYEASSREVWTTRCGVGRGETMVYWRPRHGKANDEWTNVDVGEEGEMHTDKVIHAVDDDFGIFLHVNHANNTGADRLSGAVSWDSTDRLKGLGRRIDAGALPNPDLRRLVAAYPARTSS